MERGLSGRAVVRINAALTPESQPNPEHSKQLVEDRDLKTTPPGEPKGKTVYLTGGEVDKTSVSLRFSSDTLDPDEISNLLDCRPTHSYRKGDVLPDRYGRIAKKAKSPKLECGAYVEKKLTRSVSKTRSLNYSAACQTTLKSGESSRANIILICSVGYLWKVGIEE
jgi:hypothetical protein